MPPVSEGPNLSERRRWYLIFAFLGMALTGVTYWLSTQDPFAPLWVCWPVLLNAVLATGAMIRALNFQRVTEGWRRDGRVLSKETGGRTLSKIGGATVMVPLVFGAFVVRATAEFWTFAMFLGAALVAGVMTWNRVGQLIRYLPLTSKEE